MDQIIENKSLSIEGIKKKTDALQTKIKFQAFGKTKPPTVKAVRRRLEARKQSASRLKNSSVIKHKSLKMK